MKQDKEQRLSYGNKSFVSNGKNEHFFVASQLYSVFWANEKLTFGIAVLQGKIEASIWKRRLQTALIIKDELMEHGYVWQSERLENWIHKLEKQEKAKDERRFTASSEADSQQKSKREASF